MYDSEFLQLACQHSQVLRLMANERNPPPLWTGASEPREQEEDDGRTAFVSSLWRACLRRAWKAESELWQAVLHLRASLDEHPRADMALRSEFTHQVLEAIRDQQRQLQALPATPADEPFVPQGKQQQKGRAKKGPRSAFSTSLGDRDKLMANHAAQVDELRNKVEPSMVRALAWLDVLPDLRLRLADISQQYLPSTDEFLDLPRQMLEQGGTTASFDTWTQLLSSVWHGTYRPGLERMRLQRGPKDLLSLEEECMGEIRRNCSRDLARLLDVCRSLLQQQAMRWGNEASGIVVTAASLEQDPELRQEARRLASERPWRGSSQERLLIFMVERLAAPLADRTFSVVSLMDSLQEAMAALGTEEKKKKGKELSVRLLEWQDALVSLHSPPPHEANYARFMLLAMMAQHEPAMVSSLRLGDTWMDLGESDLLAEYALSLSG